MSPVSAWIIAAIVLGVAELLTGTFWLLVLALGALAAAAAMAVGAPVSVAVLVAAVVCAVGAVLLKRLRPRRTQVAAGRNPDVLLDIGSELTVTDWGPDGRGRAQYRGATWDVERVPGESAGPGRYRIVEIHGSRLRVKAVSTGVHP